MENKIKAGGRIVAFDVLRAMAALIVVMVHVSATFITNSSPGTMGFTVGNVFDSLSRFGVPVFIMLTGALVLNEEKEYTNKKLLKSALNIFVLLCIWSLFYAVVTTVLLPVATGKEVVFRKFIEKFVLGHSHLWYLYMTVGIYLLTPILRLFVKKCNKKIIEYYIILSVIFVFLTPIINYLLNKFVNAGGLYNSFISMLRLGLLSDYIAYCLIGWYLTNFEIEKGRRAVIYLLGLSALLTNIICVELISKSNNNIYNLFYSNGNITVMLYAVAVFLMGINLFKGNKTNAFTKIMQILSKISFGIYVIHVVVLIFVLKFLPQTFPSILQLAVNYVVTLAVTVIISFVMSKIPLIKKLIRC